MKEELNDLFMSAVAPVFRQRVLLLQPLHSRFGPAVLDEVRNAVRDEALREWRAFAASEGDPSMKNLVDLLWNRLCAPLGFRYTITDSGDAIQIRCDRCPIFDYARTLNALDWGFELNCAQDPFIALGFNPGIEFTQTKWIMRGDPYCDHRYALSCVSPRR